MPDEMEAAMETGYELDSSLETPSSSLASDVEGGVGMGVAVAPPPPPPRDLRRDLDLRADLGVSDEASRAALGLLFLHQNLE